METEESALAFLAPDETGEERGEKRVYVRLICFGFWFFCFFLTLQDVNEICSRAEDPGTQARACCRAC
jgi:hypothetical protein